MAVFCGFEGAKSKKDFVILQPNVVKDGSSNRTPAGSAPPPMSSETVGVMSKNGHLAT